jgi:hypothetical protein
MIASRCVSGEMISTDTCATQAVSLYLRTGLCFECQRNLNETRRNDRKRGPKTPEAIAISTEEALSEATAEENGPSLIYALAQSSKKFRLNGSTIRLNSDAIIINGAVQGTKPFGEGYGFQEIGHDLHNCAQDAAQATERLLNAVACHPDGGTARHGAPSPSGIDDGDISVMYDTAFLAMNRSIFLLSQWKASWDVAIAAAHETVSDPSFADVVASVEAAAAAEIYQGGGPTSEAPGDALLPAASSCGHGNADPIASDGHNMVSLLLAADRDEHDGKGEHHHHLGVGGCEHEAETAADVVVDAVAAPQQHDNDPELDGNHGMDIPGGWH